MVRIHLGQRRTRCVDLSLQVLPAVIASRGRSSSRWRVPVTGHRCVVGAHVRKAPEIKTNGLRGADAGPYGSTGRAADFYSVGSRFESWWGYARSVSLAQWKSVGLLSRWFQVRVLGDTRARQGESPWGPGCERRRSSMEGMLSLLPGIGGNVGSPVSLL